MVYSHHGLLDNINMESGVTLLEKRREKEIFICSNKQRYFDIIDKKLLIKYLAAAHNDLQKIFTKIDDFIQNAGEKKLWEQRFLSGNV